MERVCRADQIYTGACEKCSLFETNHSTLHFLPLQVQPSKRCPQRCPESCNRTVGALVALVRRRRFGRSMSSVRRILLVVERSLTFLLRFANEKRRGKELTPLSALSVVPGNGCRK